MLNLLQAAAVKVTLLDHSFTSTISGNANDGENDDNDSLSLTSLDEQMNSPASMHRRNRSPPDLTAAAAAVAAAAAAAAAVSRPKKRRASESSDA